MNLWLSSSFLVAGLFLCSSALTPEECQPLITPLYITPPMLYGKTHFLYGYYDNEVYKGYMKNVQSYWFSITQSSTSPNDIHLATENRLNNTCLSLDVIGTIDGATIKTKFDNFTSTYKMLPTCDGCRLYSFERTTKDLDTMYKKMRLNAKITSDQITMRGLHLFVTKTTVTPAELEHFRKQASCLGFTGEPDYIHDHKYEFCPEGQGLRMREGELHSLHHKHHSGSQERGHERHSGSEESVESVESDSRD
ncbi:uncharacterized protein [Clinocottus analis]|uniref:uncharacterized protein isoform X2 n=1 Tax=Clinocottus analis TaxID=304258 RepID=UPI0035C17F7A